MIGNTLGHYEILEPLGAGIPIPPSALVWRSAGIDNVQV